MWSRLEKAVAVVGSAAISVLGLFAITRRSSRALGDAEDDHQQHVLEVAADAFRLGDVKRGEKILEELPLEQRTLARCTRAVKKRYLKGGADTSSKHQPWKSWEQVSDYHLYAPLVAEPMFGKTPKGHPYTDVTINTSRTTDLVDHSVTDWTVILGDLGPTESYPDGEYRYLVSGQTASPSQSAALRQLGYDVVIPCNNVPLSGRRRRTRR